MKKLFFLFAFLGLVTFTADAQSCSKSKSTAGADKAACCAKTNAAAAKAAKLDDSIVRQVSNTGDITYSRKSVCEKSGNVSFTAVEYCTKSNKFVNVSPSEKKAACSKKASATKVSSTSKKACCAKGAKKTCGSKASKTEKAAATNDAKVKFVKAEEGH